MSASAKPKALTNKNEYDELVVSIENIEEEIKILDRLINKWKVVLPQVVESLKIYCKEKDTSSLDILKSFSIDINELGYDDNKLFE